MGTHLRIVSIFVATSACTRSGPDVLPENSGSRPRECRDWHTATPPPEVDVYRASWHSVFRDASKQATLAVALLEWTFYTVDGRTHGQRTCFETVGVDPRLSIAPTVDGAAYALEGGGHFELTLDLPIRGPARTEGDKTLTASKAYHRVRFNAKGDKVEQLKSESPDDSTLRPPWGDVDLVFEDSKIVVEPAAI